MVGPGDEGDKQGDKKPVEGRAGIAARLLAIGRRCGARPVLDDRIPEEIIGYDERGFPN